MKLSWDKFHAFFPPLLLNPSSFSIYPELYIPPSLTTSHLFPFLIHHLFPTYFSCTHTLFSPSLWRFTTSWQRMQPSISWHRYLSLQHLQITHISLCSLPPSFPSPPFPLPLLAAALTEWGSHEDERGVSASSPYSHLLPLQLQQGIPEESFHSSERLAWWFTTVSVHRERWKRPTHDWLE